MRKIDKVMKSEVLRVMGELARGHITVNNLHGCPKGVGGMVYWSPNEPNTFGILVNADNHIVERMSTVEHELWHIVNGDTRKAACMVERIEVMAHKMQENDFYGLFDGCEKEIFSVLRSAEHYDMSDFKRSDK